MKMQGFGWVLALAMATACFAEAGGDKTPADAAAVRAAIERINSVTKAAPPRTAHKPDETALGKQLFFDPRLSRNGAQSCASCHQPAMAFTDGLPRGRGLHQRELTRRTPGLLQLRYNQRGMFFWDGRAANVKEAALAALQNPLEMDQDLPGLIAKLELIPGYARQFRALYGGGITSDRVAGAIEAFLAELAELPEDSPFDRQARDPAAMTPAQQRGFLLAVDKARCIRCHSSSSWTDGFFHNIGLKPDPARPDPGRWAVEPLPNMKGAFRTPSLRNAASRAPYMHDGSLATLREVVEFYDRGGDASPLERDFDIFPLGLTSDEKDDLVAFLHALDSTPPRVELPHLPPNSGPDSMREAFERSRESLAAPSLGAFREYVRVMRTLIAARPAESDAAFRSCLSSLDGASERASLSVLLDRCEAVWNDGEKMARAALLSGVPPAESPLLGTWNVSKTEISAAVFFASGTKALAAGREKSIKVWDVASGRALASWESGRGSINGLAVSPDGRTVLSASDDKNIYFHDLDGAVRAAGRGHAAAVNAVAFSPDGLRAVSGGDDAMVRIWDASTGKALSAWTGHRGAVRAVCFSPDGRKVLSASHDSTVKVWDAGTGAELATWRGHAGRVFSLALSPDGRRAFSGGEEGVIKSWELATGKPLASWNAGRPVNGIAVSPDGLRLLTGAADLVEVRDAASGKKTAAWRGHSSTVFSVAFSPDGRRALSAGWDSTVRLWDSGR